MENKEYEYLKKLTDRELFDYLTESDASQRKWVAQHLLELRRNQELVKSAKLSACAAWVAALIAGGSLAFTLKSPPPPPNLLHKS